MRCFAEERRLGTLETLFSAPLSNWTLVIGKWSGCFIFFIIISALALCFPLLLLLIFPEQGSNLGFKQFENWIGSTLFLLIFGGTFTAIGVFSSSMTKNQMVAGMLTFTLLTAYLSMMVFSFGNQTSEIYFTSYQKLINGVFGIYTNGLDKFGQFSVVLIDLSSILNQVVLTIFFLILSTIQIERLNN